MIRTLKKTINVIGKQERSYTPEKDNPEKKERKWTDVYLTYEEKQIEGLVAKKATCTDMILEIDHEYQVLMVQEIENYKEKLIIVTAEE